MPKDVLLYTTDLKKAREEIAKANGRVTHVFGKTAFVAQMPNRFKVGMLKHASLRSTTRLAKSTRIALDAWKAGRTTRTLRKKRGRTKGLKWDTPGFGQP